MQESQNTSPPGASDNVSHNAPRLALIAAVAANGVIGAHNALPWRVPEDLRRFRRLTTGHSVIMGRRTWESLNKPLAERQNIVVTHDSRYAAPGAQIATSFDEALRLAELPAPIFCIGGGQLYRSAFDRADTLYLTLLDRAFDGEVTFPEFDRREWREVASEAGQSEGPDRIGYRFVTYERYATATTS